MSREDVLVLILAITVIAMILSGPIIFMLGGFE